MSGQKHAPAALYPRERPGTHFTGGWVGPMAGLEGGKSRPHRASILDLPARSHSLYRLSYPAHASKSRGSKRWLLLLYQHGAIYEEFMPDWRIVNSEFYVQVLEGLLKRVSGVTPRFRERGRRRGSEREAVCSFCMIAPLPVMP